MCGLAAWILVSADPLVAESSGFGWSLPLRLPIVVAHAALAMEIAARFADSRAVAAIRAVGRLALSNYLLCSLLMTSLFYGYGAGLFARLDRTLLLGVTLLFWAVLLAWSTAWRNRWRQGPAEWLWRRLVRGRGAASA
jgi:uncharacterized protein